MGKFLIYAMLEGKGGVEEYVLNLARYSQDPERKYGYIIIGNKSVYEKELESLGVDYFFIPKKSDLKNNIKALRTLLKSSRKEYDTVYFNTSGLYYPVPYILAKRYGYRIILHSHSSSSAWPKCLIHYVNRMWILPFVSTKLSCSSTAAKWMFGRFKATIVPNAIKLDRFQHRQDRRTEYRAHYSLEDYFVLGNIGRLDAGKNQVFILSVLFQLWKEGIKSKLLLVGQGENRKILEQKAIELGILDHVVFAGSTDHPEYFYSAMDCFVMPSLAEGFPITLIEAQANGLPCVVSDTITTEVNLSGHVRFVSLGAPVQIWCDNITNNMERYNCLDILKEKGFDVYNLDRYISELLS